MRISRFSPCSLALILAFSTLTTSAVRAADAPAAPDITAIREMIKKQIELINAGDVDGLKPSFLAKIQGKLTKELLEKAKVEVAKMKIEEIAASAATEEGGKYISIKMASGRTLSTLEVEDGKWVFSTLYFK